MRDIVLATRFKTLIEAVVRRCSVLFSREICKFFKNTSGGCFHTKTNHIIFLWEEKRFSFFFFLLMLLFNILMSCNHFVCWSISVYLKRSNHNWNFLINCFHNILTSYCFFVISLVPKLSSSITTIFRVLLITFFNSSKNFMIVSLRPYKVMLKKSLDLNLFKG